ncbi:unnamed protein product [Strongylus vulgaris]|uniref:Uncharacterized protein n=1 Tax=Strongylus vulgaris TaxID=40348 RepID=A0A3P7ISI0_STRVU|nr:unnamed protein product [Strongylus vulgaris]
MSSKMEPLRSSTVMGNMDHDGDYIRKDENVGYDVVHNRSPYSNRIFNKEPVYGQSCEQSYSSENLLKRRPCSSTSVSTRFGEVPRENERYAGIYGDSHYRPGNDSHHDDVAAYGGTSGYPPSPHNDDCYRNPPRHSSAAHDGKNYYDQRKEQYSQGDDIHGINRARNNVEQEYQLQERFPFRY